jgi:hypothetical protein
LAGILFGGIVAILLVKRWRAALNQGRESPEEQLARYRHQLAGEEITLEEFQRISRVLQERPQPGPTVPPAPTGNGEPPAAAPGQA